MQQKVQLINKGMMRDLSPSKHNKEFAYENKNIRITANNGNTLLSVTNEKGNKQVDNISLPGFLLGYNILNNYVIVFTTDDTLDYIYRISSTEEGELELTLLLSGSLNFDSAFPIESVGIYETELVQKVYWVDGKNQLRMINVAPTVPIGTYNKYTIDIIPNLKLNDTIKVVKIENSSSLFASGVIQFAFSYYNLYGQESNIFNISDIQYITKDDRGGSPEETCSCAFSINIQNFDYSFDYIRIYSIHRTSINATPTVKIVKDIPLDKSIHNVNTIITSNLGYIIDPSLLLFLGGDAIIPKTLCHKDNTLFLANYTLQTPVLPQEIKDYLKNKDNYPNKKMITFEYKSALPTGFVDKSFYISNFALEHSDTKVTTFKSNEWYRFGIQLQHTSGKWSEIIFIEDKQVDKTIKTTDAMVERIYAKYTLPINYAITLKNLGYKRMRGVVVYPEASDRSIVAQGILCPTVYNVGHRKVDSPYVQASWFARPMLPCAFDSTEEEGGINSPKGIVTLDEWASEGITYNPVTLGIWTEFRHNRILPANTQRNCEVQNAVTKSGTVDLTPFYSKLPNHEFFVDTSVVTFHSPDIEFNSNLDSIPDLDLRIIGYIPITASKSDNSLTTSTGGLAKADGYIDFNISSMNKSPHGLKILGTAGLWEDRIKESEPATLWYAIYPWHRTFSLNFSDNTTEVKSAGLKRKCISNIRYSSSTNYFNSFWYPEDNDYNGISTVKIFNSNEIVATKLNIGKEDASQILYYGNVDSLITNSEGYPIFTISKGGLTIVEKNSKVFDPINIKYKSTPHAVFAFNNKKDITFTLPSLNNLNRTEEKGTPFWNMKEKGTSPIASGLELVTDTEGIPESKFTFHEWYDMDMPAMPSEDGIVAYNAHFNLFFSSYTIETPYPEQRPEYEWIESGTPTPGAYYTRDMLGAPPKIYRGIVDEGIISKEITIKQGNINHTTTFGGFWLGELYRKEDKILNRFGGTSEDAINNNTWLPCGEITSIDSNTIKYTKGDTYYQRYDCLKTYSYSLEDKNSIVDIISFMCETQINIDGRYDRNKGNINNLNALPTNFNLINPVYSQRDNFFVYKGIDSNRFANSYFPNSVLWSSVKTSGEEIDSWSHFPPLSFLELDGSKGEIQSLKTYNNNIYSFQTNSIGNILYNSRVQTQTSDGLPIELKSSGAVEGVRYLNNKIGCDNKWSIALTSSGIYFIDSTTNGIYKFDGQLQKISDTLGFNTWLSETQVSKPWTPKDFNNFITHYDIQRGDIYFTNKDYCLCYSELLGQFISFLSYEGVPAMFNLNDKFYSIKNNKLWVQNEGDYNYFYGVYKPFSVTHIINDNDYLDKTFNNLEYRNTATDKNGLLSTTTFDNLKVWNDYQSGESILKNTLGISSSLKQKFRIWRALIPRDKANGRDRIRNPWMYLQLSKNTPNTDKIELHDIVVHYSF